LARLVAAVRSFVAVGFKEIPAALGQDDSPIVRAERATANEPFVLQMQKASTRVAGIITQVVEVTLRHDSKRTDRPEHAALDPVDLVDAFAIADGSTLTVPREVQILREDVTRVALLAPLAFAAATSTTEVSVP
jgi:hypothetical protein